MAYEPYYDEWENEPSTETPITAEALTHIEQGIADAHSELAETQETLEDHNHSASDITSGTLSAGRIPSLAQSKITGLADALGNKANSSDIPDVSNFVTEAQVRDIVQSILDANNEGEEGGGDA